ncbi:MAG: DUF202 domain-containing protein [Gammaproteobacteria bacterium]
MPDQSQNASEQIQLMQQLVELSAERSYQNAERTLSVWIRTALSLMIFGIAIDRFGLLLRQVPWPTSNSHLGSNTLSVWGGGVLIALGVLMVIATGMRFHAYSITYCRHHSVPWHHGPYMASTFAALVAIFGIAMLIIPFVFAIAK